MDNSVLDVVVVGAGFAGIGMGIKLKRDGKRSFVVLERASQVGGTWRDNTYPGVGCDIPSHLYSYSFRLNPQWSLKYSGGKEIWDYLSLAVVEEQLSENIQLNTELLSSLWNEEESIWNLITSRGALKTRNLVLACGRLAEPRLPPVPGVTSFEGDWFHSARWRHDVSLQGKKVGIVGSGASAIQIIPEIVDEVSQLAVLQRSAPYVVPRNNEAYSQELKTLFQENNSLIQELRDSQFWGQEEIFTQRLNNSETREAAKATALEYLSRSVQDEVLRNTLTPDYEYGCKRVLLSDDYYPALTDPKVAVIPSALREISGNTVKTLDGTSVELDVLIFATGFLTLKQPYAERIFGRGGKQLSEYWANGMRAFGSTIVAGYPNMFIIDGPNTALGHNSAVFMIESQIEFVMRWLAHQPELILEVDVQHEDEYISEIQLRGLDTVWMSGNCNNPYVDRKANRLTVLWPDNAIAFQKMLQGIKLEQLANLRTPARNMDFETPHNK